MRKALAALAMLLLAGISYACIPGSIDCYLTGTETVDSREINPDFGSFYIVSINGVDSLVLDKPSCSLVRDELVIYSILRHEYLSDSSISVDMDNLLRHMDEFNASRYPEQATCEQYTGVDRFECTDFSTCRYACLSVPLCRGMYEGLGDTFVYATANWRARNAELDSAMEEYLNAVSSIQETPESANKAWDQLSVIEEKAGTINSNALFSCDAGGFCFCYSINFSYAKLNETRADLQELITVLSFLPSLQTKAKVIKAITEERITVCETNNQTHQYQEMMREVNENLTGTQAYVGTTLSYVDSRMLSENMTLLVSIRDQMYALGEAQNYTDALAMNTTYYSQAKTVNDYAKRLMAGYRRVNESRNELDARLQDAKDINEIGGYFSESYIAISGELILASNKLKPPVGEDELTQIDDRIASIALNFSSLETKATTALKLLAEAKLVELDKKNLSQRAEEYQQNYDFSEIDSLLASARSDVVNATFSSAEGHIDEASDRIGSLNRQLDEKIPLIRQAQGASGDALVYLNERKGASFMFFSADSKGAENLCDNAISTIYSSPADSLSFSKQCKEAVDSELQALEFKKYGTIGGAILALVLFYLWARNREWGFVVG